MSTDKQNIDNELAMAILNGLSGPNACKAADEQRRMIPLHIADQAVAACEKEIAALKAEVERLRKAGDDLDHFLGVLGCTNDKGVRLAWRAAKEGKPSV